MKYLTLTFPLLILSISATAQGATGHTAAKLISGPNFAISAEDEAAGIGGTIKVAAKIDTSGNVTRAMVYVAPSWPCSGDIADRVVAVMRAAEGMVRTYRFSPATENGKPVDSAVGISLAIGKEALEPAELSKPAGPINAHIPKQIDGGVINGKALSLSRPPYPPEARAERASRHCEGTDPHR